jgi:hypothetical protein
MTDEFDTYDDDEDEDTSEDEDTQSDDAAGDKGSKSESDEDSAKTLSALQSTADKATARANKLQKQLDEKVKSGTAKDENGNSGVVPPEIRQWLDAAKERTQEASYKTDSRFKDYSIDPAFIQGESPSKMKDSAERLSKLVTEIEGKVRNAVLVEHGFSPEPATSERNEPKNYGTMSPEEFKKVEQKALSGGMLRRS